ncbi:hypothetical protein SZ64_00820 [Erythrobacter sp. SG61-1L]|uniref:MarR family winged helix-turn-helix transcriptional regulator n=1 Tax=Erythrobacter sp. SG61-1L TaxID=1603897 RepID=UPI0006C92BBA|nr:MarR family transcriptional regulator [Erythrobacter sp. SG61-1L]KPL66770.1 hypothetical protein SZ64_00820 [Erythrobacter sp. SG61-1L]
MTESDAGSADDFDAWSDHYNEYYPVGSRLDLEFRTSRLLVLAARNWMYRIDNLLRQETGQSRARWQVLFAIAFAEQPATMSDIAHRARVQWPTLVRVVESMERDGLITRENNPADKRSKLLRLTKAGDDVVAHIQPTLDRERTALLSGLSDEDLPRCTAMLQKIFEAAIR